MENAKNLHFPESGQEQERFKPVYYLRQVDVKELQAMAESGEFGGVGDPYGGSFMNLENTVKYYVQAEIRGLETKLLWKLLGWGPVLFSAAAAIMAGVLAVLIAYLLNVIPLHGG